MSVWKEGQRHGRIWFNTGAATKNKLRIMHWNILADGLAQNGKFEGVHQSHLSFAHRFPLIIEEIRDINPDVIGLVECNHFELFQEELLKHGYEGNFTPKAKSPAQYFGSPPDGVCIFWRSSLFSRHDIICSFHAHPVCAGIRLHLATGKTLCIFETHLKANSNPDFAPVRLQQIRRVLSAIDHEVRGEDELILVGDMNCEPEEPAIKAVISHRQHFQNLTGGEEIGWTTWKARVNECGAIETKKRVIDYMFASERVNSEKVLGCIRDNRTLPNEFYPSDHVHQVVDVNF